MNNQEAIEVIKLAQAQIEWDYPMDYTVAFDMAISALQEQEAKHSIESSLTQNALDLISRQAAIDAANKIIERDTSGSNAVVNAMIAWSEYIRTLPSAQQEDCDTCKHGYFGDTCCNNCKVRFPSHYERRTDGSD